MIFKNSRGSALIWAMGFVVLSAIVSLGIISSNKRLTQISRKEKEDAFTLVNAHSVAALLKQDLEENYRTQFKTGNWADCSPSGTFSMTEFITALSSPPAGCKTQNFNLRFFRTVEAEPTDLVALQDFQAKSFSPAEAMNSFSQTIKITDFNLGRSLIYADLTMNTSTNQSSNVGGPLTNRTVKLVIDLNRTISPAAHDSNCAPCRAIPGSLCCGRNVASSFISFLEVSTGRVIQVSYDESSKKITKVTPMTALGPFPILESIKNVEQATPRKYRNDGFCVKNIQGGNSAVLYVIDAATGKYWDTVGNKESAAPGNFFLTTHGYIILEGNAAGDPVNKVVTDPKVVSIAYSGAQWYILRSDGQVLTAKYINQPASWTVKEGLKLLTAYKLSMGQAPCPCKAPYPYACN